MCTTKTTKIDRLHATTELTQSCQSWLNLVLYTQARLHVTELCRTARNQTTFTGTESDKMTFRSNRFADVLKFTSKLVYFIIDHWLSLWDLPAWRLSVVANTLKPSLVNIPCWFSPQALFTLKVLIMDFLRSAIILVWTQISQETIPTVPILSPVTTQNRRVT